MAGNKTAFLVIHGVGPHQRYQVCDDFVRGFYDVYKKGNEEAKLDGNSSAVLQHRLKDRKERSESYVSIQTPGYNDVAVKADIEIYEYFWDIYMVHKTLPREAWNLLMKASKNAKSYYDKVFLENPALAVEILDLDRKPKSKLFRKKIFKKKDEPEVEFRHGGYLLLLGGASMAVVKIVTVLPILITIFEWLSKLQVPIISQVYGAISGIFRLIVGSYQKLEEAFLGDVVRYFDMDPRSQHHETRQKIINGAVEELRALVVDDEYQRIIVAGHSLGSVIAYDALNRIILQANTGKKMISPNAAKKIVGLITFGSPLDKIAFFFRQFVPSDNRVRLKILADRHTFRTCSLLQVDNDIKPPSDFYQLPDVRWLNFWHPSDLLSGKLDLYDLQEAFDDNGKKIHAGPQKVGTLKNGTLGGNIPITEKINPFVAHGCYWGEHKGKGKGTNQMYIDIIKEFFS